MIRRAVALTTAILLASAAATSGADRPVPPPPSCTLSGGVLTIDPKLWDVTIRRFGEKIVPLYSRGVRCEGGQPTIDNVETVHLLDDEVELDLRGGPFAPGLTDEGDGSSEIEFEVEHGIGGALTLRLGGAADTVSAGSLGHERDAFDLNAAESVPDVDLALRPQEPGFGRADVEILLGRGGDRFDATGGAPFPAAARNHLEISGQGGDDILLGGSGDDFLEGGRGHDEVAAGGGNDIVGTADGERDRLDCGPDTDIADHDRRDRVRRCQTLDELSDAELAEIIDG